MCMLHGVTLLQVDAMPMRGFLKSASVKPTGYSMERAAARCGPSSRPLENGRMLMTLLADDFFFIGRAVLRKTFLIPSPKRLRANLGFLLVVDILSLTPGFIRVSCGRSSENGFNRFQVVMESTPQPNR